MYLPSYEQFTIQMLKLNSQKKFIYTSSAKNEKPKQKTAVKLVTFHHLLALLMLTMKSQKNWFIASLADNKVFNDIYKIL